MRLRLYLFLGLGSRLLSFNLIKQPNDGVFLFLDNELCSDVDEIEPHFFGGLESLVDLIHFVKQSGLGPLQLALLDDGPDGGDAVDHIAQDDAVMQGLDAIVLGHR